MALSGPRVWTLPVNVGVPRIHSLISSLFLYSHSLDLFPATDAIHDLTVQSVSLALPSPLISSCI